MPPLEGEVPNEREAEGFVRKLSKKTPQSARSGSQLQLCMKHLYAINMATAAKAFRGAEGASRRMHTI